MVQSKEDITNMEGQVIGKVFYTPVRSLERLEEMSVTNKDIETTNDFVKSIVKRKLKSPRGEPNFKGSIRAFFRKKLNQIKRSDVENLFGNI